MSGIFPDSGTGSDNANNSLPDADTDTVNCPAELWYDTGRCYPRFDPAAANAILSEIINFVNCTGVPYDCTKLDNMCRALRELLFGCMVEEFELTNQCNARFLVLHHDPVTGCQQIKRLQDFPTTDQCDSEFLMLTTDANGCKQISRLPSFPSAAGACQVEPLVLITDSNGCKKVARNPSGATHIADFDVGDSYGPTLPLTQRPLDPTNPASYYSYNDLSADVIAGAINETILNNNRLTQVTFNLTCNTRVEWKIVAIPIFNPLQDPGGASSRIVTRIDNIFAITPAGLISQGSPAFTNYEAGLTYTGQTTLAAGSHTLKWYIVSSNNNQPPVPLRMAHSSAPPSSSINGDIYVAPS